LSTLDGMTLDDIDLSHSMSYPMLREAEYVFYVYSNDYHYL